MMRRFTWARRLAAEEGIFGGFSSGANLAGAVRLLNGEYTVVKHSRFSGMRFRPEISEYGSVESVVIGQLSNY